MPQQTEDLPATTTYTTLSGLTVYKGETRTQAEARRNQRLDWIRTYGSPEYGGWVTDSADGVRKPYQEVKGKAS